MAGSLHEGEERSPPAAGSLAFLPSPAPNGEQISDLVNRRICIRVWAGFVPFNDASSFRSKTDAISDQRYGLALRLCDEVTVSRPFWQQRKERGAMAHDHETTMWTRDSRDDFVRRDLGFTVDRSRQSHEAYSKSSLRSGWWIKDMSGRCCKQAA